MFGDWLHPTFLPVGFVQVTGDERHLDCRPLVYRVPGDQRGLQLQITRRIVPVDSDVADGLPVRHRQLFT